MRFLKSPRIHCRIKECWRLAFDPHRCVDICWSGRCVWQITFACFLLILTTFNINVKKNCFESSYKNISLYLTLSILFMILCTSTLIVFKFRNCKLLYYTVRNKYKQLQCLSSNPFQSTIVVHVFYCYMYIHRRWLTIILVNGNLTIC